MSGRTGSSPSSASAGDWTGRWYNQYKVCCERCLDNHRSRAKCLPSHGGTLVVLGNKSGRPAGAANKTAQVPALILEDGIFLPETRVSFVGKKPPGKELRKKRVADYLDTVRQQPLQGQGLGGQASLMPQGDGFPQSGRADFLGYAMQGPADNMGTYMAEPQTQPYASPTWPDQQMYVPVGQETDFAAAVSEAYPVAAISGPSFASHPFPAQNGFGFGYVAPVPLNAHQFNNQIPPSSL